MVRRLERALIWVLVFGLGFSITLTEASLGALALCWFARLRERGRWRSLSFPLLAPCLALAAATIVAALASARPVASLTSGKDLLRLAAIYLVLHAVENTRGAFRFLSLLTASFGAASTFAIAQGIFCPRQPSWFPLLARYFERCDRVHAFFSIYMTLAGVLSVGLLAVLPRLLPGSDARRWWLVPTCAAEAVALAMTYVRGAWVGVGAGVLALATMARRARWLPLTALLAAAAVFLVAAPSLRQRAASIVDPTDPTVRERLLIWRSGLAMVREHPLTGIGPGRVKDLYERYAHPEALRMRRGHLHDTPLQILVERGPAGLLAWLWLFAAFFITGGRALAHFGPDQVRERGLVMGGLAATVGFLVAGLFEYNFGDSEVVLVQYCVMATTLAAAAPEPTVRA